MIQVLIAAHYPIVCCGLKHILSEASDIQIIGEASTIADILFTMQTNECQLLILDDLLLEKGSLNLLSNLQELYPSLSVLVFSMQINSELSIQSLRAGVCGYITIDSTPNELIQAVHLVTAGCKNISAELAEILIKWVDRSLDGSGHHQSSDREFQVMCHLGAGKSLTEVALALNLGKTTISTYRARILAKLNLRNNVEIIRYVLEHDSVNIGSRIPLVKI